MSVMTATRTGTDLPELTFSTGLPGLSGLHRFALVRLDEVGGLFALRSLEDPDVRLLLGAPWVCAPGYEAEVDDDVATDLDLREPEDALVLLVLNAGDSLASTTVNHVAPVVVNAVTGRAAQVVQVDRDLPLRAPFGG
jgi:flagellar assembly factor FliW